MKVILFVIIFSSWSYIGLSQAERVINNESTAFKIVGHHDSIEFLIINNNVKDKKPILLWFQGSQPYPLYVKQNEQYTFLGGGLDNFNLLKIKDQFHIVVISPPTVPLIVDRDRVSNSYQFVPDLTDPNTPSIEYQKADYLENYVNRANVVMNFLENQSWVDSTFLVVAGHSQGTRVASKFAVLRQPDIIGLFSPNPLSRLTEMIRTPFFKAKRGDISWDKADKEINYFKNISKWMKNEKLVQDNPSLKAWKSFSENPIEDWFKIKGKLYIAYGTDDASADLCSIIPIYEDKFLYGSPEIVRYNDLEHNFFSRDDIPNWEKVFDKFYEWLINNK